MTGPGRAEGGGRAQADGAPAAALDHLVVAAATLEQGAAWCERLFGAAPAPGGRHPRMGTHNRLLAIGSAAFPRSYLEIIAIDPDAPAPPRLRWFGLDDPALQAALRVQPRLLHAVARCSGIDALLARLRALDADPGEAVAAERAGAHGILRWRIAGRADGRLLYGGALPTLIEWEGPHPAGQLPASGVALDALALGGLPDALAAALGLPGVVCAAAGPALAAGFSSARGKVELRSG